MTADSRRPPSSTLADLLREFELTKDTVLRLAGPSNGPDGSDPMPEADDHEPDGPDTKLSDVLLEVRKALLTHPTAARAIVGFLAAEGRRYTETEQGRQAYLAMTVSPEVETLRTVWEKVTLNLLDDESDPGPVPQAWVELVRDLAAGAGLDRVANRLRPDGLA